MTFDLAAILANPRDAIDELDRIDCEESLLAYVRRLWPVLEPGRKMIEGWPMEAITEHLEAVSKGQIQKLLITVPPGFSKSLLTNCFFPSWEWGPQNRPSLRYVSFSYSSHLTHRDNRRFRDIMLSPDYQRLFGGNFNLSKVGEELVSNDKTGWKLATSIGGVGTGERGDRVLCFPAETMVHTERGPIPIGAVVRGRARLRAWSFGPSGLELQPITGWHTNPGDRLVRLILGDGSSLTCTAGHRILTGGGYVRAKDLLPGDSIRSAPSRMLVSTASIAGEKGQIEMGPRPTRSDIVNGPWANTKLLCQCLASLVVSGRNLANQFFCQVVRAVFEIAVALGVSNVLGPRPVFNIGQPRVGAVPVLVSDLLPQWTWADESLRHQLMNKPVGRFAGNPQGDAGITVVGSWRHQSAGDFHRMPATHNGPWGAANATKIADEILGSAYHRAPLFSRLIAVEDAGHADETFCLTVSGNHNMLCGKGQQVIICSNCDDAHNIKESESDTVRQETARWFRESMSSRLNDVGKSAVIVIMQRVHEEDIAGIILSELRADYHHLSIPMEWEGQRLISTAPLTRNTVDPRTKTGELAWPARFSAHAVQYIKVTTGPYAWAAQFQQSPSPRGGGIFKREWWQLWGNPDDPADERFRRFPVCEYIIGSLDTAYGERTENDYSALTIWGVFREAAPVVSRTGEDRTIARRIAEQAARPKLILMSAWQKRLPLHGASPPPREHWETPQQYTARCMPSWGLVEWTAYTCDRFKINTLLVEAKASGMSVAQEIRRLHADRKWGVQLVDPGRQDKVSRAYSVQHLFADGMVYAPERDWADLVITQMSVFPKTAHDDLTDATCQALRHLRDIGLAVHGEEIDRELTDQMMYKSSSQRPLYPV